MSSSLCCVKPESHAWWMCAERLPSKCHRCLVADSLVARGAAVEHIIGAGAMQQHALNPLARPQGDNLVYDAGEQRALKV